MIINGTEIPKDFQINEAKVRYYSSLVPSKSFFLNANRISFNVSVEEPPVKNLIKLENDINKGHLYKPVYQIVNKQSLVGYVPSIEVLNHTIKAIKVMAKVWGKNNLRIDCIEGETSIQNVTKEWTVCENVFFCRIQSFLDYMDIKDSIVAGIPRDKIGEWFTNMELTRLSKRFGLVVKKIENEIEKNHGISIRKNHTIAKDYQIGKTRYVQSINVRVGKQQITLVQLPWGYSLSKKLVEIVFRKNPKIKKIAFVGGVGYIGKDVVEVDDLFIPHSWTSEFNKIQKLKNYALSHGNSRQLFANKKIAIGVIKTLIPDSLKFHYTNEIEDGKLNIAAYDMEMAGFMNGIGNKKVKKAAVFYTMDKELEGIHLGDTYYHEPFLSDLFGKFERGKFNCFEIIENFFLN